MKALVTGSSGHLGEGLVRTLQDRGHDVVGIDIKASEYTSIVGSINDRDLVRDAMKGVQTVYHTATLHKPHVVTHSMQNFIETNVEGTLSLLEAAVSEGVHAFIYTSTTSVFGDALRPKASEPAVWVTEDVTPIARNIYGVSKAAAEDLCHLFHRKHGINSIVLRTSRFFPEEDDNKEVREAYADANSKVNEFLFRRVDLEDVVTAHLQASRQADDVGFGKFIVSATSPFQRDDLIELRNDAPAVLSRRVSGYEEVYERLGWRMFDGIDRVYVNDAARRVLKWKPQHTFQDMLKCLKEGRETTSRLALQVGSKGYHSVAFEEGPYPVE